MVGGCCARTVVPKQRPPATRCCCSCAGADRCAGVGDGADGVAGGCGDGDGRGGGGALAVAGSRISSTSAGREVVAFSGSPSTRQNS